MYLINQNSNKCKSLFFSLILAFFLSLIIFSEKANTVFAKPVANIVDQEPSEDDWSLPSWVTKTANTGLYDYPSKIQNPEAFTVNLTWKEINPREDEFNWNKLETALAQNKPVWVRIFASDVVHTPDWIREKYKDLPIMQYKHEGGAYKDTINNFSLGRFHPLWHYGFETEYKKLLISFKQKHFMANPNFIFMYAPGAWRWNEWAVFFVADIDRSGVTPDVFFQWFCRHIDDYVDAAEGYQHKFLFTGEPHMDRCENNTKWSLKLNDVPQGKNRMVDYAVSSGMSVRIGAQEYYNPFSNIPSWGAPAKTIGGINYQVIDENHPLHRNSKRIIATENEGVGDNSMLPGTNKYFFMKMATLKALQLRMNWINTSDRSYLLAPKVVEYARMSMGKKAENSPDAWVVLREWQDPTYLDDTLPEYSENLNITRTDYNQINLFFKNAKFPYRNWERWLSQREVLPDGLTKPTQKVESKAQVVKWNGLNFEAIRTDRLSGNDYIYFDVNETFAKKNCKKIEIKVTYLDNNTEKWWIEYNALDGNSYKKTNIINNENNNKWKTITFRVLDARFINSQNGKMDFRIYNGGKQDIQVRFVRIIKSESV